MGQRAQRGTADQPSRRTGLTGSAYVRLLAGLVGPHAPLREAREAFAQGLGQWTSWTDAIALAAALDSPLPERATIRAEPTPDGDRADYERVRDLLVNAIQRDVRAAGRSPLGVDLGYGPFRQCQLTLQQSMTNTIGALRARVRRRLFETAPSQARLCAIDASLEQVIGAQQRRLLASVPTLLERHYRRLHEQRAGSDDEAAAAAGDPLDRFRLDLQALLLAELAMRLEPIEGLLDTIDAGGAGGAPATNNHESAAGDTSAPLTLSSVDR